MLLAVRVLLGAVSVVALVSFAVLATFRVPYPGELGNGDGLIMDHVVRVATGQPLYVAPSLDFIPLAYMPFYVYVVAPLAAWFGADYWQGRLISALATFILSLVIARTIQRETGGRLFGLAGAAIFLMGQGLTSGTYDSVRPDALMLALCFGGLYVLRFAANRWQVVLAGLMLSVAFFTKQQALIFAGAALVHQFLTRQPHARTFALTLLVGCGGGFLALSWWLGPWFSFYVYDVPAHWSTFSVGRVLTYVGDRVFGTFALLTVPTLVALALPGHPWRGSPSLWMWVALGGFGTGLLATLDPYSAPHTLMTSLAAFSIVGPIALHRLSVHLWKSGAARDLAWLAGTLVLTLQFASLLYPVRSLLPPAQGVAATRNFVARIERLEGPVLIPYHGFFAWKAGKAPGVHMLPLDDVIRARGNRLYKQDPAFVDRIFDPLREGGDRPTIVSDSSLVRSGAASVAWWKEIAGGYKLVRRLDDTDDLAPRSGNHLVPLYVYRPIETHRVTADAEVRGQ